MRIPILLLAVLFVPVLAAGKGADSRWPCALEKGRYQAKLASTGKVLWTVLWETQVTEREGQPQVEIREQGEGQSSRYKFPTRWKKRMVFSAPEGSPLQVTLVEGQRWKQNGKPLSSMEIQLDPQGGQIRYVDREGDKPDTAVFPWTPSALPDEMLFHWIRTLPFENAGRPGGAKAECLLLVSPKRRFFMDARVQGIEQVTTPAGTFSCYRVDFSPRLAGPIRALAPKMALWCRTDAPHAWVRYQGPVGGPGSPQAILELVKFEAS